MMQNAIEISGLTFTYEDGTKALNNLSFSVPRGSKVALLGPNGAGKSTLILHLNGIRLPQEGKITVLGKEIRKEARDWLPSTVGIVFQDPDDQLFAPTVGDDVAFGPLNLNLERAEIVCRVNEALEAVGMLGFKSRAPHHLSLGQKRRVAIAGVLAMRPEIIVLDEPLAFLDPAGREALMTVLSRLHEEGRTLVVATHDVDFAAEWAERVVVIKSGGIIAEGGPGLLTQPQVVSDANLCFPLVTQLFNGLTGGSDSTPCTLAEGRKLISDLTHKD